MFASNVLLRHDEIRLASELRFDTIFTAEKRLHAMLKQETEFSTLEAIASRVCWWQPPDETLKDTPLFLCRVMTWGTWEDATFCLYQFGKDTFREALKAAPPGLLDPRSWHYWHNRLGLPVPDLPVRNIPV